MGDDVAELAHPARIRDLLLTKTDGRSDELQAWPRLCIRPIWSLTKCRLQTNSRSPRRPRRAGDAAGCVVPVRRVVGHGRLPRADRRDRRHAQVRQKAPCRIRRNRICGFTDKPRRILYHPAVQCFSLGLWDVSVELTDAGKPPPFPMRPDTLRDGCRDLYL